MHRTTISIDEPELTALQRIAESRGISVDALIREAIEEKIDRCPPTDGPRDSTVEYRPQPMPKSIGAGRSGYTDTARRAGDMEFPPRSWR